MAKETKKAEKVDKAPAVKVVDVDELKVKLQAGIDELTATGIAATESFNAAKANAESVEQRAIAALDRAKPEAVEEMLGYVKDAIAAFKI